MAEYTEDTVGNTIQNFGDFSTDLPVGEGYLAIALAPGSAAHNPHWQANSLSADFIASYFANFFPRDGQFQPPDMACALSSTVDVRTEIKSAISYVANELLENSMKFCDPTVKHPISLSVYLCPDRLVFCATNTIPPPAVPPFQAYIQDLIAGDPSTQLIHQLERNAAAPTDSISKLGLLTIINDYHAKVGWKFEVLPACLLDSPANSSVVAVTTIVQLPI
ncbi:MAG TPA: hypothetical protein V6C88_05175 [Chroococcidiopsis sp.]